MAVQNNNNNRPREVVPTPDPTRLTTEQLLREIASSREIVETQVKGAIDAISARLAGNDKAIELLQKSADKNPEHVKAAFEQLQSLHQEKFDSIETQFKERDTRTEQAAASNKIAIDAALSAQKESVDKQNISNALAINKSEAAFTKQMDLIGVTIQTSGKATDDKINDMKDRLTALESRRQGETETKQEAGANLTLLLLGGGVLIALITLVILVATKLH